MNHGMTALIALGAAFLGYQFARLVRADRDLKATRAASKGLSHLITWLMVLVVGAVAWLIGSLRAADGQDADPGPSASSGR